MHEADQLQWIIAVINVTAVCVGLALVKLIVDSARKRTNAVRKFGEILFGIVLVNLVMIFVVIGAIMPAVWNSQDASAPMAKTAKNKTERSQQGASSESPVLAGASMFTNHPLNKR